MIGVVVPAHDEAALIGRCLRALRDAAAHPALAGEPVDVLVVLDTCRDATGAICRAMGVRCLDVQARRVGVARAAGAEALIARGARWLAFTDADSVVPPSWLVDQLTLRSDAVCGVVCVDDWSGFSPEERALYESAYVNRDGHRHVHGANLGVCARAYRRAGGFPPLASGEDVALVQRLQSIDASIARSGRVRVRTSGRARGRAPDGFAAHLQGLRSRLDTVASMADRLGHPVCPEAAMPASCQP